MKTETMEDRAKKVWENMRFACIRKHMALTRVPRHGEGYIIVSAVARFIRETGKQNDWQLDKSDISLIRQFLKTTSNVVVLGESVGDYEYRIFVREEWNDAKVLTMPVSRGPDAIDQRAKKLRPEEVGEDREPAPVEVRKMPTDNGQDYEVPDLEEAGAPQPLTEEMAQVLTFLLAHGEVRDSSGLTTRFIQDHIDTDPDRSRIMSSTMKTLEDRGLIEREVHGKRTKRVALTKKGRELTSQGLNPFRVGYEALADFLVEKGGVYHCDEVTKTTHNIGREMRIPVPRVTQSLKKLEDEGKVKVERQGDMYPRHITWTGGDRETLRQKFGRWWSAENELADVKKSAGIEEEKPKEAKPLVTTSPVESIEDLQADELLPPEEVAAFLSAISQHYKTAVEDIADVYEKEEDRYQEAKTTIDLVAEVLAEVNKGESSPLNALGDIEAIVSEWASG